MIIVHHLAQSRSLRVVWLLEELGVPFDLKVHQRDPKTMLAPPALKAIHPLGKAPIVVDDDGHVLIESGAILERLIDRHGAASGLRPAPATPDYENYRLFLHFAEGSMMPPLVLRLIFQRMVELTPALLRPLTRAITGPVNKGFLEPGIASTLAFLEGELTARAWFAGPDFSAADIQMSFPIEASQSRGGLDANHPNLMGFLARIRARPAYVKARAKIGE